MRTSSFPGDIEDAILDLALNLLPGGGSGALRFRPAAGYGGRHYAVYLNARREARAFAPEGQAAVTPLILPPETGAIGVCLEDLGDWDESTYDPDGGARDAEAATADRISLAWNAAPELFPRGTAAALAQLSAWTLAGLKRFSNCAPLNERPTRAQLEARLAVDGAQRSVSLWANGGQVAAGSRSGDGVVALAAANDSGLSGSVTVAASGGIGAGEYTLEIRYPASYEIHYDAAPLSFPRAAQEQINDDGTSNQFRATTAALSPGTYYVAVLSVSDSGVKRSAASAQTVTLPEPPQPPRDLAYSSGSAAATAISFTPSATPGATYRVYDSELNGVVRMDSFVTEGASEETIFKTLAAFSYPGVRRVLVRAVNGGVEEKNGDVLRIEYDAAGNVVGPRPNAPRVRSATVASGRRVDVRALYFAAGQAAAPATAKLFLVPETDAIDYSAPVDSQPFGAEIGGVRLAGLSATAPSDGFYKIAVRTASAGGTQDSGTAWERIHVTNAEPPAASDVVASAARG